MFLFRRTKRKIEPNAEPVDQSASIEAKEKPGKESTVATQDKKAREENNNSGKNQVKEKPPKKGKPGAEKEADSPVQVIKASEIDKEDPLEDIPGIESGKPAVSEELVDSLLVPVKREIPEDIPLPNLAETLGQKSPDAAQTETKGEKTPEKAETKGEPKSEVQAETKNEVKAESMSGNAEISGQTKAPEPKQLSEATASGAGEKTQELKAPEPPKKDEEKKKAPEGEDKGNLFSSLFGKNEVVEETPLDRLIKSLPDTSIEEVMNEAEEVKGLMNEWFQNQNRQG